MTLLGLELLNTSFAKAEIVRGIFLNLIAFGLFLGSIDYF